MKEFAHNNSSVQGKGKIVFFGIPAHGHTNPTLGVVRELVNRGYDVFYYSFEPFQEKIEDTGAAFIPCETYCEGQSMEAGILSKAGRDMTFLCKMIKETALAIEPKLCREMDMLKPDCIVADSMAIWGKAIALKLNIPFISSTTTFAINIHSAMLMKQNIIQMVKMMVSISSLKKEVNELQKIGFPLHNAFDILMNDNDTHTIVYTSSEFQPYADTFSEKYEFVGPSIRDSYNTIVKEKGKLVFISLGTVTNDSLTFYRNCLKACANEDYQVIMSVGNRIDMKELGEIPQNISVYTYVDQIAVLKVADIFISHCGMNSVNESLYYGVPLIMHPQTAEQTGVAKRVYQLGAGIFLKKEDENAINQVIHEVLEKPEYKKQALKISTNFRKCGGTKAAADKILKVGNLKQ